ncbi:MAG: dephospho-CoA kinase [Dehalococcoidia bacterium]|jgi:dephospho-CoA kinase|nr:dephospho-CoA kinase [Dehalococcoidia bacterium]|tara:strand:- start:1061 stop:1651 length:591 start_codon:yes stop_codon:yes gene_type:complete
MVVIGLTGGIATGKSEASRILQELGAEIINADLIGHEAYRQGSVGWESVVQAFGKGILDESNEIDRSKLGAIVFSDESELQKLNEIMHPIMEKIVEQNILDCQDSGSEVVVVEAALMFEAGWNKLVDTVWTTDAPEETVISRLELRNGFSRTESQKRISSQMDREDRLSRSDVILSNTGDLNAFKNVILSAWLELN